MGMKDFAKDLLEYFRISGELALGKTVRELSYNELLIYFQLPRDLIKVGPFIIISAAPFANYVTFPVAYMFPRQILSPHFWTIEQKINFALIDHRKRLRSYRPTFRHIQAKLDSVPETYVIDDNDGSGIKKLDSQKEGDIIQLRKKCRAIFGKLGSGLHPTVEEILEVKFAFTKKPYGMLHLSSRHMSRLCKIYGINSWLFGKRPRLWNFIGFIREMDLAIIREGGPQKLNQDQLRQACFMRGLNPVGMTRDEMLNWINNWLFIARNVEGSSLSLLLHCPLFLGYNQPTNWRLLRGR